MPEQLKGSACPSGPPRWPSKRRPQMPRGSERAHPEASPWRQCPDIQGSSDLGPRAQGLPDTPAAANRAAEEVLPLRGLGSPSSLPAPLQLKSRVREERGVRTVAPAAWTKLRALCKGRCKTTRKTCQRSPQGHKAQKKKAGGIGRTVKSPDENRFPDRYHPRIAYIVKYRSWGGGHKTIQQQHKCNLGFRDSVQTLLSCQPHLPKDSPFNTRVFCFTAESSSVSEKLRCSGFSWICTW